METVRKVIDSYEKWVGDNPDAVGDLETTTKWVSYFVAGRISDSNILSELVYSLSNMLVFYNDRIIDKAQNGQQSVGGSRAASGHRLKVMLTTLEYCEVFIEISAKRLFGSKGKWLLIVCVQLVKAIGRYFVLKQYSDRMVTSPCMPTLNRRAHANKHKSKDLLNSSADNDMAAVSSLGGNDGLNQNGKSAFTFQLKRSGRVVRKVEGAPPLSLRDFRSLGDVKNPHTRLHNDAAGDTTLLAEYVYIAKPLVHLAAMGIFGDRRWHQYLVALCMDLVSIRMYHKNRHLMSKQQTLEISRRCINLLMYIMRSPFYEHLTQARLEGTLDFIERSVPLAKLLVSPLKTYLPHWQSTYFYLWST